MYGTERNELLDGFIKSRSLTVSRMKAIINNQRIVFGDAETRRWRDTDVNSRADERQADRTSSRR
jgi:hypothetical protein